MLCRKSLGIKYKVLGSSTHMGLQLLDFEKEKIFIDYSSILAFVMTILLTGGTGKTSIQIARLLKDVNITVLLASRSNLAPPPYKGCRFDWLDSTTYLNPFLEAADITAVYLIAPPGILDILPVMKPFIDLAKSKGVQRFVFLGASGFEAGGPFLGKVHEYLISLEVEYAVLRPTWFMGRSGIH